MHGEGAFLLSQFRGCVIKGRREGEREWGRAERKGSGVTDAFTLKMGMNVSLSFSFRTSSKPLFPSRLLRLSLGKSSAIIAIILLVPLSIYKVASGLGPLVFLSLSLSRE